jgi:S-phase kinase-associated protein 1
VFNETLKKLKLHIIVTVKFFQVYHILTTVNMSENQKEMEPHVIAASLDREETVTGLEEKEKEVLRLVSNDGVLETLSKQAAKRAELFETLIENDKELKEEITLSQINGFWLKKVCEYLTYHETIEPSIIEKPLKTANMADNCSCGFDATFIDQFNVAQIAELMTICSYLHLESLLQLCCAKLASLMKNRTIQEIGETFGIDQETIKKLEGDDDLSDIFDDDDEKVFDQQ